MRTSTPQPDSERHPAPAPGTAPDHDPAPGTVDAGEAVQPDVRRRGRWRRTTTTRRPARVWAVPLLVVLVAAGLRLWVLDDPQMAYFDETYYVPDARGLLRSGVEDGFVVHPPVGKWLIAAGIAALGDNPLGWRIPGALAGTLTVWLTYLAGLRLFARRGAAALAGLLVAADGLAITSSRMALLDPFAGLFVVLAFWLLCAHLDRLTAYTGGGEEGTAVPVRGRGLRWLAGVALGLAIATKWSALPAVGAAIVVVVVAELAFRRETTGNRMTAWPRMVAGTVLPLLIVPAIVYIASYGAWFAHEAAAVPEDCPYDEATCAATPARVALTWIDQQQEIARFHIGLDAPHPYRSPATSWLVQARPVAYHWEACVEGDTACTVAPGEVRHILGLGNPALWWLALLAFPLLAWRAAVHGDRIALRVGLFAAALYVPWLVVGRPLFLYYLVPAVPFVALALVAAAERARCHELGRWVPSAVAVTVVAALVFWYPVWAGLPLARADWALRMWLPTWI